MLCAVTLFSFTGCRAPDADRQRVAVSQLMCQRPVPVRIVTPVPTEVPNPWTDEELNAMARTLSGECYDDKESDKRRVCEVILNRVSGGQFGSTICEVITAKNQFSGYWNTSRPVSENDLAVAEKALEDWFANSCRPFSGYLYFSTGKNRENTFYETYPADME